MNPWLAAAVAAAAVWLVNQGRHAQAQADQAAAGQQAGAGQTSDQGGGSFDPFGGQTVAYQGGVTQPVTSVNYQPPQSSDGTSPPPPPQYPGYVVQPASGGVPSSGPGSLPGSPGSSYTASFGQVSTTLRHGVTL